MALGIMNNTLIMPFIMSGGKESLEEGLAVTFTLKPSAAGVTGGSFNAGPAKEQVLLASIMQNGKVVGVTSEHIKQGLRDLGIFTES